MLPSRIKAFGKRFLEEFEAKSLFGRKRKIFLGITQGLFESSVALSLSLAGKGVVFSLKLGFGKETVFVEAIQGPSQQVADRELVWVDTNSAAKELNQELGMPWPNFLLKAVEAHARKTGYKRVIIHDPSTSHFFHDLARLQLLSLKENGEIKRRLQYLKNCVEPKNGNAKKPQLTQEEKANMVLRTDLDLLLEERDRGINFSRVEILWEQIERELKEIARMRKTRAHIRNFYGRIASANGYRKHKGFFVKEL